MKSRIVPRGPVLSGLLVTALILGCGGGGSSGGGGPAPNPLSTVATHHDAAGGAGWDEGAGIAIDSLGRILVAGRSENAAGDFDMVIWRYLGDGSLDTGFGSGGIVTDDGAAGGSGSDGGNDIALDGAGGILIAGFSTNGGGNSDMALWKYDASGNVDGSFGAGGVAVHDGAAGGFLADAARALTLDASGRILTTGLSANASGDFDMATWRYNADGTLDGTFGAGGIVVDAPGPDRDEGADIQVDSADRVVVAGRSRNLSGNFDMILWRFDSLGAVDGSFGAAGVVIHDGAAGGAGDDEGTCLALDSMGRIVVGGHSETLGGDSDVAVWRYTPAGLPDLVLDGRGFVTHHDAAGGAGSDQGWDILVDAQDGIVVTGWSDAPGAMRVDVAVWRFGAGGSLGGVAHRNTGTRGDTTDLPRAAAEDPSGVLFIAGVSIDALAEADMAIWRHE